MKIKTLLIFFILSTALLAQTTSLDLDLYREFLQQHKDMIGSELLEMHNAGLFRNNARTNWESALFHDSIQIKYNLTEAELELIEKHGFMVSERLQDESFGRQFLDIYHADLPVFISTDAILHAFHSSYDRILKHIELAVLINQVNALLDQLHGSLTQLANRYSSDQAMDQMLKDVDIYLTIPRKLLDNAAQPFYPENVAYIDDLLGYIDALQPLEIPFFSGVARKIDFSQFKPRGHYTDKNHPQLADYFKVMMWLGRMEIYLIPPKSYDESPTFKDMQRQIIDALLISELVDLSSAQTRYDEIEDLISFFVGDQDNVTLENLKALQQSLDLVSADQLLDSLTVIQFQDTLKVQPYADQKILSQILFHDPFSTDSIVPASAFMLFGQRFVIDSYVTGSVVYDRIKYQDKFIKRMLPSTLDILFTLGNDAAAQLLKPELDNYHYAHNLAALRYLVDSYQADFWEQTMYNGWLNVIRTLNPIQDREDLPSFMQTAAWWQQKMNSQLSTWTELRHDNLLYAKQSYTGGVVCSYPFSYVEPVPQFYSSMKTLAQIAIQKFQSLAFSNDFLKNQIVDYFSTLMVVNDTLQSIAQKELDKAALTQEEITFLKKMISIESICGEQYYGWYPRLYYESYMYEEGLLRKDYLVADYHTAPTDEVGSPVGWVAHAGTGPVDMAVLVTDLPGGQPVAFIGPVLSYYEYTTTNFLRLTDEEWEETYQQTAMRPAWVNLYLANSSGEMRDEGPILLTSIDKEHERNPQLPNTYLMAKNYPNPFNATTIISFIIPHQLSNLDTRLTIFDVQGKIVANLVSESLPAGSYLTKWDGNNDHGELVSSGIYFYELRVGEQRVVGKMNLVK
jgi:hypothetical protein